MLLLLFSFQSHCGFILFLAQPSFLHGTHTKIGKVTEGSCDTSKVRTPLSKRTKNSGEKQANLSAQALTDGKLEAGRRA
jgi:hypothetical protein